MKATRKTMGKHSRTAALAVLLAILLLATTACGGSGDTKPSAGSSEGTDLKKVDVVLDWYPNAIHTFLYEAIDKGYFAEEGLEVNLISPAESVDAINFVSSGKAQIGMTYPIDLITAKVNQKMPVVAIGAVAQTHLGCLSALSETGITDLKQLKGKKVGSSGTGASIAEIRTVFRTAGLQDDDYELVNVGFDLVTALTTKSVSLVSGTFLNDEVITMRNAGYDIDVWELTDYGVPQTYGVIFAANADAVKEDPELYQGFLRACSRGFADMKADEDAAIKLIMDEMNTPDNPLDEKQQRGSYETLLPRMETKDAPFLSMKEETWAEMIQWMKDNDLIKETVEPSEVMTAPAL